MIDSGTTSSAPQLSLSVNSLTGSLTSPSSPIVVGALSTYIFSLTNPNNYIPANGGSLVIVFPSAITIQSGATCTGTANGNTLTCSVNTALTTLTVTTSVDIPASSIHTISISMGANMV